MKVDVIIPSYKPDEKLIKIFNMLAVQTVKVNKIIVMNTEEKYIANLFLGRSYDEAARCVEIHNLTQWEFDHGATRNAGASYSDADILIFMTQDAVPRNEYLIEDLITPLSDENVVVSYARQMPDENSSLSERFTRSFNYPDKDAVKSLKDLKKLGIKTFFCSNVCAAYNRAYFDACGGFAGQAIFNEDMVYAGNAVKAGKSIAYACSAQVIHTHEYTNKQQFKRNFDLAVSQAMHPEIFEDISSESEGKKYVMAAFTYFKSNNRAGLIVPFVITCVWKYAGFRLGKKYEKLSKRRILKYTMSPLFFKKLWYD